MKLAELTWLQFVVVHLLFSGPKTPMAVRKALGKLGVRRSLGSFSRLIRRLESSQYVQVVYDKPAHGDTLRECRLAVTDIGVTSWKATREFFGSFSAPPAKLVPVATEAGQLANRPPRARKGMLKRCAVKEVASRQREKGPKGKKAARVKRA
jgi:hypothetical protein